MDVAWDVHHLDRYTSHDIPPMLCAATGSATRLNVGPQPHPAGALPHCDDPKVWPSAVPRPFHKPGAGCAAYPRC